MTGLLEAGTAIYVALAVALTVWIGLFIYLWRIDAQARELKRRLERDQQREVTPPPTATLRRNNAPSE